MFFWYLIACFSIVLHGMEHVIPVEGTLQTDMHTKGTYMLDRLCENSYSLPYKYTQNLFKIRLLNKHFQQKVAEFNNIQTQKLQKAIEDTFLPTGKYNKDSARINSIGTSIGWLQSFCTQCISPEYCTCNVQAVPAALYRAQIVDCSYTRQKKDSECWTAQPHIEVHKVCIESPMLRKIVDCIELMKKMKFKKKELDDVYIPDSTYFIPWGKYLEEEKYSEALQPFELRFNQHDDLELYYIEKLKRGCYGDSTFSGPGRECYTYIRSKKPYSKINTLNYQGEWKQRDVVFTFEDDDQTYELACITHLPKLYDILMHAPKKYTDDQVTINATTALATIDTLPKNHHATLRYALPSPNNRYEIDIPEDHLGSALRCTQIGGLTARKDIYHLMSALCCKTKEHTIHNCRFNTRLCSNLSGKEIECFYHGGSDFSFWELNKGEKAGHDTILAMLSHHTIDTADCFKQELEEYRSYFIEPPKSYTSDQKKDPFFVIEVCKKPNMPKELHIWKHGRYTYIKSQVYAVPLWPYMIPLDININTLDCMIPTYVLFNFLKQRMETQKSAEPINISDQQTVENSSNVMPDNTRTAPLHPKSWWDYMMQPIKKINLSMFTIKPQRLFTYNLLNPGVWLQALCNTIGNLCTRMKPIQ